jgi:hypothetical protein
MIALSCLFYISIQQIQERDLSGIKSNFKVMNHGTISKTVPWLKSVTFIEP